MANQNTQFFFKVVIIGAPNVGKTSIIERYVEDNFSQEYKATIGADFRTKTIKVDGQTVLLQIWDTAGQERFRALAAPFFRGANICVLVFDVSDRMTFESIEQWRDEFLHHSFIDEKETERFPFILLGNKSDLGAKITQSDVERWLQDKKYNWEYIETSAKDGSNIEQAFDRVGKLCLQDLPAPPPYEMDSVENTQKSETVDLEQIERDSKLEDNENANPCLC